MAATGTPITISRYTVPITTVGDVSLHMPNGDVVAITPEQDQIAFYIQHVSGAVPPPLIEHNFFILPTGTHVEGSRVRQYLASVEVDAEENVQHHVLLVTKPKNSPSDAAGA